MNMIQMMQQAQKMQKKIKEVQEELTNSEVSAQSGNGAVEIMCDGQGKIKAVKLKPEAINSENPESVDKDALDMLEDLLVEAIRGAQTKATSQMEHKMKAVTGGISIPGLF